MTLKIFVVVTFFYKPDRLVFLSEALSGLKSFGVDVELAIVINPISEDEREKVEQICPEGIPTKIYSPPLLGHPYLLPWCHLAVLRDVFQSRNDFSHFIYIEDDLVLSRENLQYWIEGREVLKPLNLFPSFVRYELMNLPEATLKVATDITERINILTTPKVVCADNRWFLALRQPYQGMYMMDGDLMRQYLSSDVTNPDAEGFGRIRERAAQGLTYAAVPKGFSSRNVLGFNPLCNSIDKRCLIHHLPNNYASDPLSPFGSLEIDSLVFLPPFYRFFADKIRASRVARNLGN